MNYEQIILDIITPLVSDKEKLKVIQLDSDNLYETGIITSQTNIPKIA